MQPKLKMKWLLIHPKSRLPMASEYIKSVIPLNLLYVGTLAKKQFEVTCIDERIGQRVPEDFSEYDIIALTIRTPFASRAYEIADLAMAQGKQVIAGGTHPTMVPEEVRYHCTSIVAGEIEAVWDSLASDVKNNTLKPLYHSHDLPLLEDLQYPDFSIVCNSKKARKYFSQIPILATKGCTVGCNFCSAPKIYGGNYRIRSVKNIIAEIKYHQQRCGKKNIRFSFFDDNLCLNNTFLEELFTEMAGLGVRWNANVSMNFAEKNSNIELARRAGCDALSVGFESLSQTEMKRMGKSSNRVKQYQQVVENIHRHRIAVHGYFMFGFDSDTPEAFQTTYDFIVNNQIEFPVFAIATPLPGTEWFARMESRLVHRNWDKYDGYHLVYKPAGMEKDELLNNFIKIQRKVYSWRAIYQRLQRQTPFWLWVANMGLHFFANGLKEENFY